MESKMNSFRQVSITVVALVSMLATARADYTYQCKDGSRTYPVKITTPHSDDSEGGTITWRGRVYRDVKLADGCKQSFVATAKDGDTIEVCTATQGYADVTLGRARFVCQMKR
jgi:hypothetical protein